MNCPNCNETIKNGSNFCPFCGCDINDNEDTSSSTAIGCLVILLIIGLIVWGVISLLKPDEPQTASQPLYLDSIAPIKKDSYSFCLNKWDADNTQVPFIDAHDTHFSRGLGMATDPSRFTDNHVASVKYHLKDRYSKFEADLGLMKIWTSIGYQYPDSDWGRTIFVVYADNELILSQEFVDSTPTEHISLDLPTDTKYLTLEIQQIRGSSGTHGAIWGNAVLVP